MEKLDPEFKAKWVAALRSGEYKQGVGLLFNLEKDSYCCLGVISKVCGVSNDQLLLINTKLPNFNELDPIIRSTFSQDHLDTVSDMAAELAKMNDVGYTFNEIADYIESNL